ncbi:VOC family protein [Paenibacillus sp. FA6]|uniref:VOC family protein n=1 Tax=Paenibacillus sp. FA6 TaxID=3413029 RepID=UPI003F660888
MIKQVVPYLMFDGNANEALEFYAQVFETEVTDLQTYGDADYPTPKEAANRIIHARLKKDSLSLYFSDTSVGQPVQSGNHIAITLEFDSKADQARVYHKLKENGKVHMELQQTFWGSIYAKVQDQFGFTWDLNFELSQ